jgi:glycosyltransferase involved in cell wall biosynthesis
LAFRGRGKSTMRLLALVNSVNHVCCRYRLAAFQSHFADARHQLQMVAWPRKWLGPLWMRNQLREADVVIIQRRLLTAWELLVVRQAAKRLIFDFDDAVFLRDSYAESGVLSAKRERGFRRMARAADLIVAGNDFLAERAATAGGSNRVRIVPTCVEPCRYPIARHERAAKSVRLVWIGSSSTLQGLERTTELWNEIGRRCPGVMLRLICDAEIPLEHLPVEFCPWSVPTETTDLAGADVGISWLPDDDWSRGKCGLKIVQYMAAGLPVVANPVGVQTVMVRHGETGFLAETPQEWCAAVGRLAADPALRRRMGLAGRRIVEKDYSVSAGGRAWITALDQRANLPRQEVAA